MHVRRQMAAALGAGLFALASLSAPAPAADTTGTPTTPPPAAAEAALQELVMALRLSPSSFASPEDAASRLAAATGAAIAANPERSETLVQLALGGLVSPGAITASPAAAVLAAVTAVMDAAARSVAGRNPAQVAALTQAAVAAVTHTGTTTGASPEALAPVAAALTVSAMGAAPAQVNAIAEAAALAVTLTRATDAVQAARTTSPRVTPEQLIEAATRALDAPATTAALSAIATVAASHHFARGAEATNEAAFVIGAAVDRGARAGTTAALNSIRAGAGGSGGPAPTVTVTVDRAGEVITLTSTVVAATVSSVSIQTLTRGVLGPLVTQSIAGVATAAAAAAEAGGPVLPALDQSQLIVSPSRR